MWDSLLYETRIRNDFQGNKNAFGFYLIDQIKSKKKSDMNLDWMDCKEFNDPFNVHSCPGLLFFIVYKLNLDHR